MARRNYSSLFCDRFRYFIIALGTLCLTSIFSNMLTLNFTLICMESNRSSSSNNHHPNDSGERSANSHPTHDYTPAEKALFHWSTAVAAMVASFPFSLLCTHYGARWVFFVTGVSAALANGAIPLAANIGSGFGWVLVSRIVIGLAYASDFAVLGVIGARWTPLAENGKSLSVLTSFSALSSLITNAASGVLCDSPTFGWPWAHYFHCLVSLALFLTWLAVYTDDPSASPFVSARELARIHRDKSDAHCRHERFVPYRAITTDAVVWTVWLNSFAVVVAEFFIVIYAPTYIWNVLHYSTTETGILGSIAVGVHIPFKLLSGYLSDSSNCLSEPNKLRLFNSLALFVPAAMYIYLCYVPSNAPWIAVPLFAAVQAALGFNSGGYYKCSAMVSRQYAEFVVAFTQFNKCSVFFVAPLLHLVFIHDEANATQWHVVFYILAAGLIGANTLFLVNATDQPREFTKITSASANRLADRVAFNNNDGVGVMKTKRTTANASG